MRKYFGPLQFFIPAVLVVVFLAVATAPSSAQIPCDTGAGVCVLTWQNDTNRTGDNLNESTITYDKITPNNFGQLCAASLDGQVYAQPLVVTGVTIGGTRYGRVAYVVTQNENYRFTPPSARPHVDRRFPGQSTSAGRCSKIPSARISPTTDSVKEGCAA
ncbi:MAG TPA: hypothetical protein VN948_20885 [Terriglobales bacterium]|nr:hypothetical protein [Terriglobales bacterium]